MNPMYSAIKARRGGLLEDDEPMQEGAPQESGGVDMKSLVNALSSEQKAQLLSLLVGKGAEAPQAKPSDSMAIEKGGMGPGEKEEIEEDLGDGHESEDEIAESLVANSDKMRAERGDKPRNLGERMRFGLANKLKKKGNS